MLKVVAGLFALVLLTGLPVGTAYASSWGGNPLTDIEPQTSVNSSTDKKYENRIVLARDSYGWHHSAVCGLELCNATAQIAIPERAPQTLGDFLGLSPITDLEFTEDVPFSGHFYLKGFFR